MSWRLLARLGVLALVVTLAACAPPQEAEPVSQEDLRFVERMEAEHEGDRPIASPAAQVPPGASISGGPVTYGEIEGVQLTGYLARPVGAGPLPGVLVIHEWWGLNDNVRAMADRLAGEGYQALAVDLYEGEVAEDRERAAQLARGASEQAKRLEENLRQATNHLQQWEKASAIGVIGWCFGGGWSLRAALAMPAKVDAVAVYYGRVPTEAAELEPLRAPLLGIFGGLDRGIPLEQVRAFESALESLGKEATIKVYPDADHAFANPSGTRYDREAAEDAWRETLAFFSRHLASEEG